MNYEAAIEPYPGAETRAPEAIERVVIHRIEVSQEDASFGDTPSEIRRFFAEHPIGQKATGGVMPYPLLIARDGTVTQTLPLSYVSFHAVAANPTSVGVACVGDFRSAAIERVQREALIQTCAVLVAQFELVPHDALVAHDSLPGASRDPEKICPGPGIDISELVRAVTSAPSPDLRFSW